jgi:hypothetical protein
LINRRGYAVSPTAFSPKIIFANNLLALSSLKLTTVFTKNVMMINEIKLMRLKKKSEEVWSALPEFL